jgi:hypothetical protein
MKVIVSVQSKGASSRGLVHYIANSKVDSAREASGRELFTEHSDDVSVEKINDFLTKGVSNKRPTNDDLHHLVISLKPEDFDRLGDGENERQKSFKEITRNAMKQFEREVGADKLAWAAGIHRNTDHPHVHIAVNKEYFDKNLEKKNLNKIPNSLLPHYEKTGEEKTFAPGILIEAANQKLDEILLEKQKQIKHRNLHSPNRQIQTPDKSQSNSNSKLKEQDSSEEKLKAEMLRERGILAGAILAKYYLEKTKENLESLVGHGDKRRFNIHDEISGKNRQISLFDLERRAEKSANQKIKNQKITDAVKKDELRKNLVGTELQKNADGIKRIKTILHNLVVKENQNLRKYDIDYQKFKPLAEKIRARYKTENKKLPIPNLTPEDLEMIQAASLEKKDIRTANYLEKVRCELSVERRLPTRSSEEISRLLAKQKLSQLKTKAMEKQIKDFALGKRAFPVEIDGSKWNLAQVDSMIEKRSFDERKLPAKIGKVLGKIGITPQNQILTKLEEVKTSVTSKLNERNEQLITELKKEKSILKTLDDFYKRDTNPEKENLQVKFSAAELAEIELLSFDLKLADVYQENWEQQKQFIESAAGNDQGEHESINESKEKIIAGRSLAREIMCEIAVAQGKEEQQLFKKNKDFQKFEIKNKKGESKFVSLAEVRLNLRGSLFDQTLEYFLENREKRSTRNTLEKIVKERGSELKENLKSANDLLKVASEHSSDYKSKSFFGVVKYLETPLFTPKELITIELRINQTSSKSEAAKLQKILDSADHSKAKSVSAILLRFSDEKESTKTAEPKFMTQQNLPVSMGADKVKSSEKETKIRDNKVEILNQERGR